jgi:protein required for attachment to host cells
MPLTMLSIGQRKVRDIGKYWRRFAADRPFLGGAMDKTWILISDAHRARCLLRHATRHALAEVAGFTSAQTSLADLAAGGDLTGAAGKGHGRTGHAGTQFEPRTESHAKARREFAQRLADFLNRGVAEQRCDALVLIATGPMLGDLKPSLSPAAAKVLKRSITADLTHYDGPELKSRVDQALQPPA